MNQAINRRPMLLVLAASVAFCGTGIAQNQTPDQKLDQAVLAQVPNTPQMVVDSDGTVHFGPRTVPVPALAGLEARQAYTNQMLEHARTWTARGGVASARVADASAIPESATTVQRINTTARKPTDPPCDRARWRYP